MNPGRVSWHREKRSKEHFDGFTIWGTRLLHTREKRVAWLITSYKDQNEIGYPREHLVEGSNILVVRKYLAEEGLAIETEDAERLQHDEKLAVLRAIEKWETELAPET